MLFLKILCLLLWGSLAYGETKSFGPFEITYDKKGVRQKIALHYDDECTSLSDPGDKAKEAFHDEYDCEYSEENVQQVFSQGLGIGPKSIHKIGEGLGIKPESPNDFFQDAVIAETLEKIREEREKEVEIYGIQNTFFTRVAEGKEKLTTKNSFEENGNQLVVGQRGLQKIYQVLTDLEFGKIDKEAASFEINQVAEVAPMLAFNLEDTVNKIQEKVEQDKTTYKTQNKMIQAMPDTLNERASAKILADISNDMRAAASVDEMRAKSRLLDLRIKRDFTKDDRATIYKEILVPNMDIVDEVIYGIDRKTKKVTTTAKANLSKGICLLDSMANKEGAIDTVRDFLIDVAQTVTGFAGAKLALKITKTAAAAGRITKAARATLVAVKAVNLASSAGNIGRQGAGVKATYLSCIELEKTLDLKLVGEYIKNNESGDQSADPRELRDLTIAQCERETYLQLAGLGVSVTLAGIGLRGASSAVVATTVVGRIKDLMIARGGAGSLASLGLMVPAFMDTCVKEGFSMLECKQTLGQMTTVFLSHAQGEISRNPDDFRSVAAFRKMLAEKKKTSVTVLEPDEVLHKKPGQDTKLKIDQRKEKTVVVRSRTAPLPENSEPVDQGVERTQIVRQRKAPVEVDPQVKKDVEIDVGLEAMTIKPGMIVRDDSPQGLLKASERLLAKERAKPTPDKGRIAALEAMVKNKTALADAEAAAHARASGAFAGKDDDSGSQAKRFSALMTEAQAQRRAGNTAVADELEIMATKQLPADGPENIARLKELSAIAAKEKDPFLAEAVNEQLGGALKKQKERESKKIAQVIEPAKPTPAEKQAAELDAKVKKIQTTTDSSKKSALKEDLVNDILEQRQGDAIVPHSDGSNSKISGLEDSAKNARANGQPELAEAFAEAAQRERVFHKTLQAQKPVSDSLPEARPLTAKERQLALAKRELNDPELKKDPASHKALEAKIITLRREVRVEEEIRQREDQMGGAPSLEQRKKILQEMVARDRAEGDALAANAAQKKLDELNSGDLKKGIDVLSLLIDEKKRAKLSQTPEGKAKVKSLDELVAKTVAKNTVSDEVDYVMKGKKDKSPATREQVLEDLRVKMVLKIKSEKNSAKKKELELQANVIDENLGEVRTEMKNTRERELLKAQESPSNSAEALAKSLRAREMSEKEMAAERAKKP